MAKRDRNLFEVDGDPEDEGGEPSSSATLPGAECGSPNALGSKMGQAPRLQHCFVVGDLVEGMFVDNCWVAGRIVDTRVRQVLIEYEKEAADLETHGAITGPRHTCRENETPRDVARKTGVPLATLLALNAERYPDLAGNSKLRAKTILALPELHVCSDGETPRQIAKRYGRPLEELLEQNGSSINGLGAGSKLRRNQQLMNDNLFNRNKREPKVDFG